MVMRRFSQHNRVIITPVDSSVIIVLAASNDIEAEAASYPIGGSEAIGIRGVGPITPAVYRPR